MDEGLSILQTSFSGQSKEQRIRISLLEYTTTRLKNQTCLRFFSKKTGADGIGTARSGPGEMPDGLPVISLRGNPRVRFPREETKTTGRKVRLPKVREVEIRRLFPRKPSSKLMANLSKKDMSPTFGSCVKEETNLSFFREKNHVQA